MQCTHILLSGKNKGNKCGKPGYNKSSYCKIHYGKVFDQESIELPEIYKQLCTDIQGYILSFIQPEHKDIFAGVIKQISQKSDQEAVKFVDKRIAQDKNNGRHVEELYNGLRYRSYYWTDNLGFTGRFKQWHKMYPPIDCLGNSEKIAKWTSEMAGKEVLQIECIYKDNKREGLCRNWDDKGRLIMELNYHMSILDGKCTYYNHDTRLRLEANVEDGKMHGYAYMYANASLPNEYLIGRHKYNRNYSRKIEKWFPTGERMEIHSCNRTKAHYKSWYINGNMKEESTHNLYACGHTGILHEWKEDGTLYEITDYEGGNLMSICRYGKEIEDERSGQFYYRSDIVKNGQWSLAGLYPDYLPFESVWGGQ